MAEKRKHISKQLRKVIFDKYGGRCAYCGEKFGSIRDMQVEHFEPFSLGGADEIENYMPACRKCNYYKSTLPLETFRDYIETIPEKLFRRNFIFKLGVKYGFFSPDRRNVEFYFEKEAERNDKNGKL